MKGGLKVKEVYIKSPDIIVEHLDTDEIILYNANDDTLHMLNQTASFVYSNCKMKTASELIQLLVIKCKLNDDMLDEVHKETSELLEEMCRLGLVYIEKLKNVQRF